MTTTAFVNGKIRRLPGKATAEWLLVEGDRVRALGHGEAPAADRIIDLDGGMVVPAFRDAHVHLPVTGLYAAGLDLRGETRAAAVLAGFSALAARGEGVLFGGNFEDPLDAPVTRDELDRAVGPRLALLARADMHSCVVSSSLLDRLHLGDVEGIDRDESGRATGYLREEAAAAAWTWLDRSLPADDQRRALRCAIELAYSRGIAEVHEMYVVEWRGWDALQVVQEVSDHSALHVEIWCATAEVGRVAEMGLPRIGGDYFLDGSFGSHTAWLREAYRSAPPRGSTPTGISYRNDDELFGFFLEAQRTGLPTAVHAIGDAAIDQALGAWEKIAAEVGRAAVRSLGHRIEHFECASDEHIERAMNLGIHASVQPAFDRLWGGPAGLYAQRLGWDRARHMNRFRTMLEAGLVVAGGSDSTVTPMDPFLQMASLRQHHVEGQRCSGLEALRIHTIGPARSVGAHRDRSTLEPGRRADLVWLDRDPVEVDVDRLLETEVLGTWISGQRVWPRADAEAA